MAICEFCGKEVPEEDTYFYEMTCPNGAVYSHDICPDCASAIVGTVNKVRSERSRKVSQEHLYDDIPGEVL